MDKITNILVVGIGGQGVMTATEILAEAAIALGHDVKKTEVAGMAQRGGVVSSHLRFGPKVLSPQITPGTADIRLGNTVMLGAIADHLPFPAEVLLAAILKRFAKKGETVLERNRQAFAAGRAAVGSAQRQVGVPA
jgi:indolepyruvate ferredoxin oxidoreductase beta subunit